ncbi:DnaB-like helicase C-terminal domain-containing protein [Mycobacteroides chelonae]|nr:DnaB-like helicase C-terminal domain-containing protein [Mycobacteroides chelonae]
MNGEPPNDIQAEQSVLGAMLLSERAIPGVVEKLDASDFYRPNHETIFKTIVELWSGGEPADSTTVAARLGELGLLTRIPATYLYELTSIVPMASNAAFYAKIVKDKAQLRRVLQLGVRLQATAQSGADSDEVLAQAGAFFRELERPTEGGKWFSELVDEFWNPEAKRPPIPTPWWELNAVLSGGLGRGRLVAIGGRPGLGKSALGLNLAAFAAEHDFGSCVYSLEMPRTEVMQRMMACGAGVPLSELIREEFDLQSIPRLKEYGETNYDMRFRVVDKPSMTVEQVIADARAAGPFDMIIVDYLQLLAPSFKGDRHQQIGHMTRALKIAAKELDCVVVIPTQLNRGPVKDGKQRAPVAADFRESGSIEQDIDCAILLHTDEDEVDLVNLIVAKNRQGSTANIALRFEKHYQRVRGLNG